MSLKKRLKAAGIIAIAAAAVFGIARSGLAISEKQEETVFTNGKETLYLWYTDETLSLALDISIYLGEIILKSYPNLYWGYRARPKNEFSANRPVILKLVGKRAYFNPHRIVFVLMIKSSKAHGKSQLYDLYRYWEDEYFIPSKTQN